MRALRRVIAAPGLWLGLCGLQLGLAWLLARPVLAAARAAIGASEWADPQRLIPAITELLADSPALASTITVSAAASAILGGALGLLLAGGVLQRLAGTRGAPEFARACAQHLGALAVIAIYGALLRLLLSLGVHALAGFDRVAEVALLAVAFTLATCIGDVAAARRVVRGDRGLHPREYLRACVTVLRRPRLWAASGALGLLRWVALAGVVLVAVHGFGEAWSPWAARGLACVTVFLSLWRTAVAVDAVAAEARP